MCKLCCIRIRRDIVPTNPLVTAKPRQLPLGISTGVSFQHGYRFVKRHISLEIFNQLFIADSLHGSWRIPILMIESFRFLPVSYTQLACHESQIKWMLEHDKIDFIDFVRTCSKYRGLQCSVPFAEGFRQYAGWPRFSTKRLLP